MSWNIIRSFVSALHKAPLVRASSVSITTMSPEYAKDIFEVMNEIILVCFSPGFSKARSCYVKLPSREGRGQWVPRLGKPCHRNMALENRHSWRRWSRHLGGLAPRTPASCKQAISSEDYPFPQPVRRNRSPWPPIFCKKRRDTSTGMSKKWLQLFPER